MKAQNGVEIRFYYGRTGAQRLNEDETQCVINVSGELFAGISRKSKKDMFCKEKARRTSIARALSNCDNRATRRRVWDVYWTRK